MNKLVYSLLASLLVLTACFEDEGNYDYREMNPPRWLVDNTQPSRYYAYQGYDVGWKGAFYMGHRFIDTGRECDLRVDSQWKTCGRGTPGDHEHV